MTEQRRPEKHDWKRMARDDSISLIPSANEPLYRSRAWQRERLVKRPPKATLGTDSIVSAFTHRLP